LNACAARHQHIAFTDDIYRTVTGYRCRVKLLDTPDTYYEKIDAYARTRAWEGEKAPHPD
jgi:4-hydroxyphenylpyruvate dioxygenase-like putative hemolysin